MQASTALRALTIAFLFVMGAAAASAQPAPEANPSAAPVLAASASPSPSPTPTPPYNRMAFREVGPAVAGGRAASLRGVVDDPKLYYLGSAGGGVWKTVNGGATWTPLFDKQSVASIGAVAIDPKNHDVVWGGAGETNPRND